MEGGGGGDTAAHVGPVPHHDGAQTRRRRGRVQGGFTSGEGVTPWGVTLWGVTPVRGYTRDGVTPEGGHNSPPVH